jgi:fructose-specific phosphotransferase system component IIB
MDLNKLVSELTIADKICLYNTLYEDLACKGIDGDTELAHVNKQEMAVLRAMGGSGTINPNTNLVQFGGGGSPPPPPPATSTVTQQATIPEELKPFITDILEKSKAIQERREEEGYVPFQGPRLADFTEEQQTAFEGIKDLQGAGQPFYDLATGLTASSAQAPTSASVNEFMNPFIQNVIDVQTREALRQGDVERQNIGAQAVAAGGFGGSRQAILEAEQARNLQQRLGDIQARGQAAAFEDAQARLQQQRERERQAGAQFMGLGTQVPGQRLREITGLEAVGAQKQALGQAGIDIAAQEFEIGRSFPERTLQDYQSIVRGYAQPIPASTLQRQSSQQPAPSFLSQAAGLGAAGLGAFKAFGGNAQGGLVGLAEGGLPAGGTVLESQTEAISERAQNDPLTQSERQPLSQTQQFVRGQENEEAATVEEQLKQIQGLALGATNAIAQGQRQLASMNTAPGMGAQPANFGGNVGSFGFKKGGLLGLKHLANGGTVRLDKGGIITYDKSGRPSVEISRIPRSLLNMLGISPEAKETNFKLGDGNIPFTPPNVNFNPITKKDRDSRDTSIANALENLSKDMPFAKYGRSIVGSTAERDESDRLNRIIKNADPLDTAPISVPISQAVSRPTMLNLAESDVDPDGELLKRMKTIKDVPVGPGMSVYGERDDTFIKDNTSNKINVGGDSPVGSITEEVAKVFMRPAGQDENVSVRGRPAKTNLGTFEETKEEYNIADDTREGGESIVEIAAKGEATPPLTNNEKMVKDSVATNVKDGGVAADYELANTTKVEFISEVDKMRNSPEYLKMTEINERLKEATGKERELLQKQLDEGGEVEKGYALMDLGFGILAQPGGQTFLEAIGKGAKDSKFTTKLAKLSDKQKKLSLDFAKLDRRELQDELGLSKQQATMVMEGRKLDIQSRVANAQLRNATTKQQVAAADLKLKNLNTQIKLMDHRQKGRGYKIDTKEQINFAQEAMKNILDLDNLSGTHKKILSDKGYDVNKGRIFSSSGEDILTNMANLRSWTGSYNKAVVKNNNPYEAEQTATTEFLKSLPSLTK